MAMRRDQVSAWKEVHLEEATLDCVATTLFHAGEPSRIE